MKKIIAIGVAMAVILVLASAGPVAATNSSGTLVEPGDPDRGLQSAPLVGPGPIGYINTNSAPFFCDIWVWKGSHHRIPFHFKYGWFTPSYTTNV